MFWKRRKQKNSAEDQLTTINIKLLEEHLDSIRVSLLEIRSFRQKKVVRTPTIQFMQPIDIEEAWPGCREAFQQSYTLLSHVAGNLDVEYEAMRVSSPFGTSIDQFVNLIDRITVRLDEGEPLVFPQEQLRNIDDNILKIQQTVNLIKKYVMTDFTFSRNSKA